jgi:hypothetical protein
VLTLVNQLCLANHVQRSAGDLEENDIITVSQYNLYRLKAICSATVFRASAPLTYASSDVLVSGVLVSGV